MLKGVLRKFVIRLVGRSKPKNAGYTDLVRFGKGVGVIGKVSIGDYSFVGRGTMLGPNCKSIGKYCSIGPNCLIGPNNHPKKMMSTSAVFYSESWGVARNPDKHRYNDQKIVIENDVWIGANVVITGNVTISNGAIIGANAVVTKDVPPYAVVGGVPAKLIEYRFNESTRARLMDLKWWDMDVSEALKLYRDFRENISN